MAKPDSPARGAELRSKHSEQQNARRDASLEFKTTPDKMAAFISAYSPAEGDGEPLSLDLMRKELLRSGFEGQLDPDGANFALKRAAEGKSIVNVALVRGKYPQNAEDGHIISDADFNFPVLPGMEIGKLCNAVPASSGINLAGEEIPALETNVPKELTISRDGYISYNKDSCTLTAEQYGLVKIKENEIHITPLISVSPDAMQVKAILYPNDCFGMKYNLPDIEPALKINQISRPLQHVAGQTAIENARSTQTPQEAVIVQGTEPVPGKDGFFEYARKDLESSIGTTDENDRIDFKNRGVHPMVNPGDVIGKIHPPVEGKAGEDVYGRMTPPPGGSTLEIKPGIHVAPLADGITYKATSTGIVNLKNGELSVQDVLVTKGDVDYSTGNIKLEKGSVHVNGSIREGFAIDAPDHIVVEDSIEGADVYAGGDIEVKGGLVMGGKGVLRTGGNITAQFAANARIECGDEMIITHEISNCLVRCKGPITAHGSKGVVQGGALASETGIEVKELGSEIGVKTIVAITSKHRVNATLAKEREDLRARLLKINNTIGQGDDLTIMNNTPAAKQEQMKQILILRGRIKLKLGELRRKLKADQDAYYKSLEMLSIRVHRKVYPGVEIRIGGKTVQISKPINRIKFRFDAAERTIVAIKF